MKRLHWLEWAFLLLALVSILGTLGITIQRVVYTRTHKYDGGSKSCTDWKCNPDFTFAILLILNLGTVHKLFTARMKICFTPVFLAFCTVYAVDGVLREQKYEMLTYGGGVLVITVYVISNYIVKGKEDEDIRLVSHHV